MNSDDKARELAEMLDRLCREGSGHINVTRESDEDTISEETEIALECKGNMACKVPTLHKGIDDE